MDIHMWIEHGALTIVTNILQLYHSWYYTFFLKHIGTFLWFNKYINVNLDIFMYNCCILSPFLLGASGTAGPAWATCKCIKSCAFSILIALYKDVQHLISVFSHSQGPPGPPGPRVNSITTLTYNTVLYWKWKWQDPLQMYCLFHCSKNLPPALLYILVHLFIFWNTCFLETSGSQRCCSSFVWIKCCLADGGIYLNVFTLSYRECNYDFILWP